MQLHSVHQLSRENERARYTLAPVAILEDSPPPRFLTGTSAEYLGRRALPRAVRDGAAILVLGPPGVGKTRVSARIAGEGALSLDTAGLHEAIVERVRNGRWGQRELEAPSLVLDGPAWLGQRRGVLSVLAELLTLRAEHRLRTVVVQCDSDGSALDLVPRMAPGAVVVVGLRFPVGSRGRLRFARRLCDELGVPRSRARGTETLEPWAYELVSRALQVPPRMRKKLKREPA